MNKKFNCPICGTLMEFQYLDHIGKECTIDKVKYNISGRSPYYKCPNCGFGFDDDSAWFSEHLRALVNLRTSDYDPCKYGKDCYFCKKEKERFK